jgi:hypothetical protein
MDIIGFLCVSLGSSTVQLHDSLGSIHTCACSEAGFSSQNGDNTTEEQRPVVLFLWAKGIMQRIFIKKFFQGCSKVTDADGAETTVKRLLWVWTHW